VLREASRPDDLTTYLNGDTLIAVWPDLYLPKGVRQPGKTGTRTCAPPGPRLPDAARRAAPRGGRHRAARGERHASGNENPSDWPEVSQLIRDAGHDDADADEDYTASIHLRGLALRRHVRCLVSLLDSPQFIRLLLHRLAQPGGAIPGFCLAFSISAKTHCIWSCRR
jgi:hypothetical protein